MNEQTEKLASEIQSIMEIPFWLESINGVVEFVGLFLILPAITYLYIKSKAPGTTLLIVSVVLYASSMTVSVIISLSFETMSNLHYKILMYSEIIGSFSVFLFGYGLLRYAIALKRNES